MKYLLTFFLFALSFHAGAQETCYTPAQVAPQKAMSNPDPLNGDYCITAYVEVDSDVIQDKGAQGSRTYVEGLLKEVSKLYAAQGITVNWEIKYWDNGSPYTASSTSALLSQFRSQTASLGGYDGDVAHLITYRGSGGIAYVDAVCSQSFGHAVSSIRSDYRQYPTYSWSVEVIAHELGHNLGSPHTQSCVWNGNNTAIDGCSPFGTEGGCPVPPNPSNGGTIMSYCHLNSAVGINFQRGFHPQPLSLIKNRIANAQCVECTDDPGGPDDPVDPDPCAGNQIIVEIQLDNYAPETSWKVLNGDGAILGASEPFDKLQMNTYHADTLCLPDGCYTFVITDVDGLGGYGCSEGMYIVQSVTGEVASGQNFTTEEATRFCLGKAPPAEDCDDIVIGSLAPYANQDRRGASTITDGTLTLTGNTWKAQPYEYTVTPNTVLKMEVFIGQVGEIHAIALVDNVSGLSPSTTLNFGGSQGWGIEAEQAALFRWDTITIPVGQLIPSFDYTHLVYVNDYDSPTGDAVTKFRNIELCESKDAVVAKMGFPKPKGTVEDEDNGNPEADIQRWIKDRIEREYRKPYPSPVNDTLTMPTHSEWQVWSIWGVTVKKGTGDKILMQGLDNGAYFVKQDGKTHIIILKQ
jgi:hypothetical protein